MIGRHNMLGLWLAGTALLAVSTPTSAGAAGSPTDDGGATTTWGMTRAELATIGLGQSRGEPIPVPVDADRLRDDARHQQHGGASAVIFINFDGETLTGGSDNSIDNVTQIGPLVGPFAAYGDGAKRDATVQAVRADWGDFNVQIADSRPASGNYAMCMTGPTNPYGGGVLGIAPLDCNDQQTPNNIVYAFHSVSDNSSASTTATTIGQEVAHSYGLEHVNQPGDIMNPFNAGGDPSFRDECISIDPGQNGILCGEQHAAECGSTNQQNSYQELLTLFGPSTPDAAPPTVAITAPTDGAEFSVGDSFDITVDAADDIGVTVVTLFTDGVAGETDQSEPFGWGAENIPEGTYELYVDAEDQAGNVTTSNTVTIFVGVDAPADSGNADAGDSGPAGETSDSGASAGEAGDESTDAGGGEAGGEGGGNSASDTSPVDDDDDGDDDDGALPSGFGSGEEPAGCVCATAAGRTSTTLGLLVFLLAGLARRRPARRSPF